MEEISKLKLYPHQEKAIEYLKQFKSCLIGDDMGLGKTFEGSEMLNYYANNINLVVCQKSKITDWLNHFKQYYDFYVWDLTKKKELYSFIDDNLLQSKDFISVGVINYDLLIRRPELFNLTNFTLLLDESSEIKNEHSKRGKFVLKMNPKNVILLSGTPMNGKFEELWSQLKLLGWQISRELFDNQYMDYKTDYSLGFPRKVFLGYKNKERLLRKLHDYGGVFRKTEEVFELPQQLHQEIKIPTSKNYLKYEQKHVLSLPTKVMVGDNPLTDRLNKKELCGIYSLEKVQAYQDLINSTNDRMIVFYNYVAELETLEKVTNKPMSYVNGSKKDLTNYEEKENSITFVQYQSGSMGINLQKANRMIFFTPPDGNSIHFEQAMKRIHRIGQNKTCFYYYLIVENSIEEEIYKTLDVRKYFNQELFRKENEN